MIKRWRAFLCFLGRHNLRPHFCARCERRGRRCAEVWECTWCDELIEP